MLEIKSADFVLNCDDIYIIADERKLEELFLNLVINAVQALDKEKGLIGISCYDEKAHVKVEVIDNGVGADKIPLRICLFLSILQRVLGLDWVLL